MQVFWRLLQPLCIVCCCLVGFFYHRYGSPRKIMKKSQQRMGKTLSIIRDEGAKRLARYISSSSSSQKKRVPLSARIRRAINFISQARCFSSFSSSSSSSSSKSLKFQIKSSKLFYLGWRIFSLESRSEEEASEAFLFFRKSKKNSLALHQSSSNFFCHTSRTCFLGVPYRITRSVEIFHHGFFFRSAQNLRRLYPFILRQTVKGQEWPGSIHEILQHLWHPWQFWAADNHDGPTFS